jgi:hypothetical protein
MLGEAGGGMGNTQDKELKIRTPYKVMGKEIH